MKAEGRRQKAEVRQMYRQPSKRTFSVCYPQNMALKASSTKKPQKVLLRKASASEIIEGLGISQAEERRARAAVATAKRLIGRRNESDKKRVSSKVATLRKPGAGAGK
jgi:hypothetical protein